MKSTTIYNGLHRWWLVGLVIAGGYDVRVEENVEYLQELQTHCQSCGLRSLFLPPDADLSSLSSVATKYDVIFRISISSAERLALFALTRGNACLLYPHYCLNHIDLLCSQH